MEKTSVKTRPNALTGNGNGSSERDYIVSVDLGYNGTSGQRVHHFLYASQVYDTMFGIFGIFDGKEIDGAFVIEKISLELVNYRGLINVGFTEDPLTYGKAPEQLSKQPFQENSLYFFVQGTSLITNKDLGLNDPIKVSKGQRQSLTFNRMLCPLPETLAPLGDGPGSKTPHGNIFDSEFYYRNGVDFYRESPRPGQFNPKAQAGNGEGNLNPVAMPSLRCHQSNINLVYYNA